MRKIIAIIVCISVCFVASSVSLAASKQIDISKLSEEELLELRDRINIRLDEIRNPDDILFEDKDITIKWMGFDTKLSSHVKNGLLITNKTNKPLYYGITKIAYNGIQVTAANSFLNMEIGEGLSYLTTTDNLYLVDLDSLSAVGINRISDIVDVYLEVSFYKSDDYGARPIKTCKLRFANE